MIKMRKQLTPETALIRLEQLCVKAEHCSYEMAQKLRTWGMVGEEAEKVLTSLKNRRFVDDARYAAAFVRDRYRFARYGRIKIRMLLRAKHINDDIIDRALEEIDDDVYLETLKSVIRAKRQDNKEPLTFEERGKIYRHALSRGYEPELISKILR